MSARQGNFLYYNIADLILCGVMVVLTACTIFFFMNEEKMGPLVNYCLLAVSCLVGFVLYRYSTAAVDNKWLLLLLIPLKLLLAGVFLILGFIAIGSFCAALDKKQSNAERLGHVARGTASAVATGVIFHFIKRHIKH